MPEKDALALQHKEILPQPPTSSEGRGSSFEALTAAHKETSQPKQIELELDDGTASPQDSIATE